ncbi:MAG: carboxypeptidase-like regulatory domain-containing protein [Chloroflexota bacterium]
MKTRLGCSRWACRATTIALAMLAATILSTPAFAEEQPGITGQVVNRTADGQTVGGLEVTLITYINGQQSSQQKTTCDDQGGFEFRGLSADPSYAYEVYVSYQGVEYTSPRLVLKPEEPIQSMELSVYETTEDDSAIETVNSHMVLYLDQGTIQVLEVWRFVNAGDRTYIGSLVKETRHTLQFTLPRGAQDILSGDGFDPQFTDSGMADTLPLPPGIRDISFTYLIPYSSASMTVSRQTDYPVVSFGLLVQDKGVQVKTVALAPSEPLTIADSRFLYFVGQNLARGTDIDISLTGLPMPAPDGTSSSEGVPWQWLAGTAVALALILGAAAYARLRRGPGTIAIQAPKGIADAPESEREALLLQIASLDNDFDAGRVGEQEYRARRSQLKARVIELTQQAERGSHG